MLHIKIEGKQPRRKHRTRWIDQIRKDIDIWWENEKKMGSGRTEIAGDLSVIAAISLEMSQEWWFYSMLP